MSSGKLMMMILLLLVVIGVFAFLFNQGAYHKAVANRLGSSSICVDGVEYLQFPSGASVKYLPSGQIATCR